MTEQSELHEIWKRELFSLVDWKEPRDKFWRPVEKPRTGSVYNPSLVFEIKQRRRLERSLLRLGANFGLSLDHAEELKGIGKDVAHLIEQAFWKNRSQHQALEGQNEFALAFGYKKTGPDRLMPIFLAKWLLVAFELHRHSKPGLRMMRDFMKRGGDLEKKLRSSGWNDSQVEGIIAFGGGRSDLGEWRSKKRQQLERLALSVKSRHVVKTFGNNNPQLANLRANIAKKAKEIVKAAHAR